MDCTAGLIRKLFADSQTATSITCARTKTEAIINDVTGPHTVAELVKSLNDINCIGIATDASNHGAEKLFPIIIQYFDWKAGAIQTMLLELDSTPNDTSETISKYLTEALEKYGLSSKCVAFAGDNANVNFGGINREEGRNVFSQLKTKLKKPLVGLGCPALVFFSTALYVHLHMYMYVIRI